MYLSCSACYCAVVGKHLKCPSIEDMLNYIASVWWSGMQPPKVWLFNFPKGFSLKNWCSVSVYVCLCVCSLMLWDSGDCIACQAPLSMEFSRQEYWTGLPFPTSGDLPNPGIKPMSPALQADSLPSNLPGKPNIPTMCQVLCYSLRLQIKHTLLRGAYSLEEKTQK